MEEGPPAPGLTPVRGSAPDPAGAAPLRPALKSKTFLKGENTLPKMLANLTPLPPPKSQIRKEALRRSFAPPSGSSFDYKMLITPAEAGATKEPKVAQALACVGF